MRTIRPSGPAEIQRKRITFELAGDVHRFANQLCTINERIVEAVLATGTTVTDIHGIGPLGATIILGHTGDITRFPTSGHYARYTGTAPHCSALGEMWVSHSGTCTMAAKAAKATASTAGNTNRPTGSSSPAGTCGAPVMLTGHP